MAKSVHDNWYQSGTVPGGRDGVGKFRLADKVQETDPLDAFLEEVDGRFPPLMKLKMAVQCNIIHSFKAFSVDELYEKWRTGMCEFCDESIGENGLSGHNCKESGYSIIFFNEGSEDELVGLVKQKISVNKKENKLDKEKEERTNSDEAEVGEMEKAEKEECLTKQNGAIFEREPEHSVEISQFHRESPQEDLTAIMAAEREGVRQSVADTVHIFENLEGSEHKLLVSIFHTRSDNGDRMSAGNSKPQQKRLARYGEGLGLILGLGIGTLSFVTTVVDATDLSDNDVSYGGGGGMVVGRGDAIEFGIQGERENWSYGSCGSGGGPSGRRWWGTLACLRNKRGKESMAVRRNSDLERGYLKFIGTVVLNREGRNEGVGIFWWLVDVREAVGGGGDAGKGAAGDVIRKSEMEKLGEKEKLRRKEEERWRLAGKKCRRNSNGFKLLAAVELFIASCSALQVLGF